VGADTKVRPLYALIDAAVHGGACTDWLHS